MGVAENPAIEQDRAFDLYDTWKRYGYCMFPQQREIYRLLGPIVHCKSVLEAGCGNGLGSSMLWSWADGFTATDKIESNIRFAKELYPWMPIRQWDVEQPWDGKQHDIVVAVEMLEHLVNSVSALRNMLNAAKADVIFTTPDGAGKPKPPANPCHVREYTIEEVSALVLLTDVSVAGVEVYDRNANRFVKVGTTTNVGDPVIYRIVK